MRRKNCIHPIIHNAARLGFGSASGKKFLLFSLIFALVLPIRTNADETNARALFSREESNQIYRALGEALREYDDYYSPKTHSYYIRRVEDLPSVEQVRDLFPNPVGYGSGLDDSALYVGTLLVGVLDLYDLTKDEALRPLAYDAWFGMKRLGAAHRLRGVVTRGVAPQDGESIYITSSRDQYTHYVEALYRFYHSALAGEKEREEIRILLTTLADAMEEQITPENEFSILRADGSHDPRGLHKMWHVYAHEAARLPMIYAAAWSVSRERKYYDLYSRYAQDAIEQSLTLPSKPQRELNAWVPTYCFYQMQCSLILMYEIEENPQLREQILHAISETKNVSTPRFAWVEKRGGLREYAELLIAQTITPELVLDDRQKERLAFVFRHPRLKKSGIGGVCHLIRAYAQAVRNGYCPLPEPLEGASGEELVLTPGLKKGEMPHDDFDVRKVDWRNVPTVPDVNENRIVFLSDVFCPSAPGESAFCLEKLKQSCEKILALRPRPAAVFFVGNLAPAGASEEDYLALKPTFRAFEEAKIPLRFVLGEWDSRAAFEKVFPEYSFDTVAVFSTPRADFILLNDDSDESLAKARQLAEERKDKNHLIVSATPLPNAAQIAPSARACIHGGGRLFREDKNAQPLHLSLPSPVSSADGAPHEGFCYLQMDKWEFVFRIVTNDPDDVWARRPVVLRFAAF
ncbi:MAG: hypothetical protein Q4D38_10385 [Planctomycetia bacterium]|nr:hypothetical protein [Planctomycetia bacterium]